MKIEGKRGNLLRSKRSQVAIFIIVAIVIASVLLIIFYPNLKKAITTTPPVVQVPSCVEDSLEEAVDLVSKRGGSIEPENTITYGGEGVEYLCYTNQYYQTCSVQRPLLRAHIEKEILNHIEDDIVGCVNSLKSELSEKGYSVQDEGGEISVELKDEFVQVVMPGLSFTKGDESERYEKFVLNYKSELYELVMIANNIIEWESLYGEAEISTYMIYYPYLKVEKHTKEDGSKVYVLTNTNTNDKFVFASRSLSWPAGYGIGEVYNPEE